jgi:hypothetical protein
MSTTRKLKKKNRPITRKEAIKKLRKLAKYIKKGNHLWRAALKNGGGVE